MSDGGDFGKAVRFVLIAMAVFAAQDGISKYLAAHYPIPWFVMIRYWFFALFVLALSARAPGGVRGAATTSRPVLQISRGVLLVIQICITVTAFHLVGLAATHSILALHPLLAVVIAIPILGERVGWRRFAAVGFAFLGMLVILRPGAAVMSAYSLVPLVAAFGFAFYTVLTRLANRQDGHSRASFFYTGVAGAVAITAVGPFFATPMTLHDIGWLMILSLTGMTGHYFLIRSLDETEAVRIQPFVYLQTVFAILIGWTVFDEPLGVWTLTGVTMIIGAGLYAVCREIQLQGKDATEATPRPPEPVRSQSPAD